MSHASQYLKLINAIGERAGRRRGWQRTAAMALLSSSTLVSQALAGKMEPKKVAIARAAKGLAIPISWFDGADDVPSAALALIGPRPARAKRGNRFTRTTTVNAFGRRLATLMAEHGVTRAQLLARSGIPNTTLYRWETSARHPRRTQLAKLAAAFGLYADALLPNVTTETPDPVERPADSAAHVLHLLASMPPAERSLLLKYAAERWPS